VKLFKILCVLALGATVLLASFGCSAQRRPDLGQNPQAPTAPAPERPLPTDPNQSSRLADQLAGQANQVQGVDSTTVVLTGSTALVGINLKSGADAATVKNQVADVVKRADNRVKNVLVSTDPELNQRIVSISKGLAEGRPLSAFTNEVNELIKRLSPAGR